MIDNNDINNNENSGEIKRTSDYKNNTEKSGEIKRTSDYKNNNKFSKKPFKQFKKRTDFVRKEIIYDEKQLYNYGINRLSVRDYARKELFLKMSRFQKEASMVNQVLDKLEEQGYLSDARRIRSMLIQYDSRESINKTKSRIMQKGVTKEQLQDVIYEIEEHKVINEDDEYPEEIKKAIDLLIKKYKTFNNDNWDKMVRFLASKGFKYDNISKSVKAFSKLEDND